MSSPMSEQNPICPPLDFDFDHDGKWNDAKKRGPAIHAPSNVKDIVTNQYRIEWLDVSDAEKDYYPKNHIVATLLFVEAISIGGILYKSARVSMERVDEKKVVAIVGKEAQGLVVPGYHYLPGVYTVKLLPYDGVTDCTVHYRTFPLRNGTTIGHLIDDIIRLKMHHFFFLPYTVERRWKGCGDHVLHCWANFVRNGYITSGQAIEPGAEALGTEITYTYLTPNKKTLEYIGRGWWVSCDPEQDEYTPETIYTDSCLTYQLPDRHYKKAEEEESIDC